MNVRQLDEIIAMVDDPNQEIKGLYKANDQSYQILVEKYENGSNQFYDGTLSEDGDLTLTKAIGI